MTYEEKLEIVVQAIKEAKQFSRKDCLTKMYFGQGNGLSRVGLDMTYDIRYSFTAPRRRKSN